MIGTGIVSHTGLGYHRQILCITNHVLTYLVPKLGTILFFSESILGTGTIGTTGTTRYHCNSVPVPKVPLSGAQP